MATPNLSYQNKYSSTLSSGITASDTTISITSLPTPSEGYLVIEPDSSTAWEVIYYTSKTGSAVVCPSVAAGRGVGGSTAASHSSGATVRMDSVAEFWTTLQDATGLTGLHRYGTDGVWFDFVASGCVWSGDAYASTLNGSMTSGVVYINGRRHTVATITAHAFTASKDTYVDLLYSTVDNIATPVYTEVSNNAASPALASNSVRIGIVVSGAGSIAAVGSVNQGQETKVLPIASSIPYQVADSLGNLICPRDPNRRILGSRRLTTSPTTTSASLADVTGLNVTVNVPTGRKVRLSFGCKYMSNGGAAGTGLEWAIVDATASAEVAHAAATSGGAGYAINGSLVSEALTPAAAGVRTYKIQMLAGANTTTMNNAATNPGFISVELV